jgi:hypothetical protein
MESIDMRRNSLILAVTVSIVMVTNCYADCDCDDWMKKGGYCVDYIKTRIPAFPIPQNTTEIAVLTNKEVSEVAEGDVAMFNFSNYWHVAYVEKVHQDQQGNATAIDVSEMNYGGQLSFDEYKNRWRQKSRSEWKRALCCGVTDNYDETSSRKKVALNTVRQIWSPTVNDDRDNSVLDKVRDVLNRFIQFTGREL